MGDVYNWSTVLRTEYNVINDNCGAHRVNSLRVSDGRSRVAEPRGRWEVCLYPQRRCFAACSGFRMVGPATRNLWGVGIARPTAALLRSLQWVSDSRSRVAKPVGRWEVCLYPQLRCFAACSGVQIVGPASRNLGGVGGLLDPQRRCFAACSGFLIVGPAMRNLWGRWEGCSTHSGAASQLAVGFGWSVPLRGTYGVRWEMAVSCVRCTVPCVDAQCHV